MKLVNKAFIAAMMVVSIRAMELQTAVDNEDRFSGMIERVNVAIPSGIRISPELPRKKSSIIFVHATDELLTVVERESVLRELKKSYLDVQWILELDQAREERYHARLLASEDGNSALDDDLLAQSALAVFLASLENYTPKKRLGVLLKHYELRDAGVSQRALEIADFMVRRKTSKSISELHGEEQVYRKNEQLISEANRTHSLQAVRQRKNPQVAQLEVQVKPTPSHWQRNLLVGGAVLGALWYTYHCATYEENRKQEEFKKDVNQHYVPLVIRENLKWLSSKVHSLHTNQDLMTLVTKPFIMIDDVTALNFMNLVLKADLSALMGNLRIKSRCQDILSDVRNYKKALELAVKSKNDTIQRSIAFGGDVKTRAERQQVASAVQVIPGTVRKFFLRVADLRKQEQKSPDFEAVLSACQLGSPLDQEIIYRVVCQVNREMDGLKDLMSSDDYEDIYHEFKKYEEDLEEIVLPSL